MPLLPLCIRQKQQMPDLPRAFRQNRLYLYLFLSLFLLLHLSMGSSCCLINRLTAGCRCRPANGRKGQGRTTTTPNGIGFVLLDKTGAQGIRGCPL